MAAGLASLRGVADELVIGADDRVGADDLAWYGSVADTLVTYPFLGPNQHRNWLSQHATGDWLLLLDDDEIPSQVLLDALPGLIRDPLISAYRLAIWWLSPDGAGVLDERPWSHAPAGYLCRLVRNDDRVWFPSRKHTGAQTDGPTKRLDLGIIHLALAVDDHAARLAKVATYESQQFGLLTEGRPTNEAYYLPESRSVAPAVRPLSGDDRARVTAALNADGDPPRRRRPVSARASESDLRRTIPWTPFADEDAKAVIEVLDVPARVPTGMSFEVELSVANLGNRVWPSGPDHLPAVRVSYHWFRDGDLDMFEGRRSRLPHPLRPGEHTFVTCQVDAPERYSDGATWTLAFDIVVEHDRWFGALAGCNPDVTPAPRQRLLDAQREGFVPLAEVLSVREELAFTDPLSGIMHTDDRLDDLAEPYGSTLAGLAVGEWALDRAALHEIAQRYTDQQPEYVVEFGSGTSTVLLAALARRHGRPARSIVSVEQSAEEAERVRQLLVERQLETHVELVVAPLVEVREQGITLQCYDPDVVGRALTNRPPALILVDGPSQASGGSRFPTLLSVQPHLAGEAHFLIDDAWRDLELAAAIRWSTCEGIRVDGVIPLPKGMLTGTIGPLERTSSSPAAGAAS